MIMCGSNINMMCMYNHMNKHQKWPIMMMILINNVVCVYVICIHGA
jgi:hypothetical protein